MFTLTSSDGTRFPIDRNIANHYSEFIKASDPTAHNVILNDVPSKYLELIIEYMNHYKLNEPLLKQTKLVEKTPDQFLENKWDIEFIKRCTKVNPDLIDISNLIFNTLKMENLGKKLGLQIAYNLKIGASDIEKINAEMAKLAIQDGGDKKVQRRGK